MESQEETAGLSEPDSGESKLASYTVDTSAVLHTNKLLNMNLFILFPDLDVGGKMFPHSFQAK